MNDRAAWSAFWSAESAPDQAVSVTKSNALSDGWRRWTADHATDFAHIRAVDIGTGSGILADTLRISIEECGISATVTACDYSQPAITALQKRSPALIGVVADSADLPFADAAMDLVVSQFGIEYADPRAFSEAARVLSPGGALRIVAHKTGSSIANECRGNQDALNEVISDDLLGDVAAAFEATRAMRSGRPAPPELPALQQQVMEKSARLRECATAAQSLPVGPMLGRLYTDLRQLFERMAAFAPDDVITWCRQMDADLQAYRDRMVSMTGAALDDAGFAERTGQLVAGGLVLDATEQPVLRDGEDVIGWVIEAHRPLA